MFGKKYLDDLKASDKEHKLETEAKQTKYCSTFINLVEKSLDEYKRTKNNAFAADDKLR